MTQKTHLATGGLSSIGLWKVVTRFKWLKIQHHDYNMATNVNTLECNRKTVKIPSVKHLPFLSKLVYRLKPYLRCKPVILDKSMIKPLL